MDKLVISLTTLLVPTKQSNCYLFITLCIPVGLGFDDHCFVLTVEATFRTIVNIYEQIVGQPSYPPILAPTLHNS
jgi:hypothetical protein